MTDERHSANPGYAVGRLQRALETAASDPDLDVRERARIEIDKWRAVIDGMAEGRLSIGSRVPVADTPAWVTLEVAHGGFATGRYLAEGAMLAHELDALERLGPAPDERSERERLNLHYLSDAGQMELLSAIERDAYRVQVPEEGALMVVAWLVQAGHGIEALELVEAIRGLMHRLRFYPALEAEASPAGACVRVATSGEVLAKLRAATTPMQLVRMNATLGVWGPLFDRLVALWLTTVEGEAPGLDAEGRLTGGWPARRLPSDWIDRRDAWLADYRAALQDHGAFGKHHRAKSNFSRLRDALERCPTDTAPLSGRDVGFVRLALASTLRRQGAIGSEQRTRLRVSQAADAARPLFAAIAQVVADRLAPLPADAGVTALELLCQPITEGESRYVPVGAEVPAHIAQKVERALEAPIAELIERGVIGSAESLALVLPQITASIAAAGIGDRQARALYAKIYAAFRRRRSLLLLNLDHQVQIDELPWVRALAPARSESGDAELQARHTLEEVAETALSAFAHTILPNRLVREMSGLAKQAKLELPLVEEVAADIFMGTFTTKWVRAAQATCAALRHSLYARYYDLPGRYDPAFASEETRWGKTTAPGFAALCRDRAREAQVGKGSLVAQNGTVLEQSQILTSHNLVVVAEGLDLTPRLAERAPELVRGIFAFVRKRHAQVAPHWKARLQMVKNTAYAWRQAIYFLSLTDEATQRALVTAFAREVEGSRLSPVAQGTLRIVDGARFDERGLVAGDERARRFLGWSVGPHWILEAPR